MNSLKYECSSVFCYSLLLQFQFQIQLSRSVSISKFCCNGKKKLLTSQTCRWRWGKNISTNQFQFRFQFQLIDCKEFINSIVCNATFNKLLLFFFEWVEKTNKIYIVTKSYQFFFQNFREFKSSLFVNLILTEDLNYFRSSIDV